MRRILKYHVFTLALSLAVPVIADPMSLHSAEIVVTQEQCEAKAVEAITNVGVDPSAIKDWGRTITAKEEDIEYQLVCMADKGVVFMVVHGPNAMKALKFVSAFGEAYAGN